MNRVSRRGLLRGIGLASLGVVATTHGSRTAMAVSDWSDTSLTYESSDGTLPAFEITSDSLNFQFAWSNFPSGGATINVELQARLANEEVTDYETILTGSFDVSESKSQKTVTAESLTTDSSFPVSVLETTSITASDFRVPDGETTKTTPLEFRLVFSYDDVTASGTTTVSVTVKQTNTTLTDAVRHYPFAERSSTSIPDALGGTELVSSGTTNVAGNYKEGYAEQSAATSEYINAAPLSTWYDNQFNSSAAVAVTVEAAPTSLDGMSPAILGVNWSDMMNNENHWVFRLEADSRISTGQGYVGCNIRAGDSSGADELAYVTTDLKAFDNTKHRVVYNWDDIANTGQNGVEIWVDGQKASLSYERSSSGIGSTASVKRDMYMNASNNQGSSHMNLDGMTDNWVFFDRPLSDSEIQEDFDAQPWS